MKRMWFSTTVLALILSPVSSVFSIDYVHRLGVERPVGGAIKTITRTEVVVFQTVGNKEEKIPTNEIVLIEWDAEPSEFKVGRGDIERGNYPLALKNLSEAAEEAKAGKPNLIADIDYFIARTTAKMAIADPTHAPDAVAKLKAFVAKNRESFRYYEAQNLLAEVALRTNDAPAADTSFNEMVKSPWPDTQMAGKIGLARVMAANNNLAGAKTAFDGVAALDAKTPLELTRKHQAMLGQARCLQLEKKHAEAVKLIDQIVEQTSAEDTRTLAEAYLRQGDSILALGGDPKDALLAYLHVDVIPALASEVDLHAEALFHLSKLWTTAGKPDRAADAANRLKQDHPKSDWAKKVAAGS